MNIANARRKTHVNLPLYYMQIWSLHNECRYYDSFDAFIKLNYLQASNHFQTIILLSGRARKFSI